MRQTKAMAARAPSPMAAAAPLPVAAPTAVPIADTIDISAFKAVDLRVARVISAVRMEKSKKLMKLKVDIGSEERQIMAGIAEHYTPEDLTDKHIVVIVNLKTAKLMGEASEGMVLAASDAHGRLVLLKPEKEIAPGAKIS